NNIRLVFFGDGPCKESLVRQAAEQGLDTVTFHPSRPHDEVPQIMAALDAGLVTLSAGQLFHGVRPSKLFEGMAAGKPVVLAGDGEVKQLVAQAECGLVVPPEDPRALAGAIGKLTSDQELR